MDEPALPGNRLVPLAAVLCTEELHRRPTRPHDYETENRALIGLAQALADSPRTILQTLAEKILVVLDAGSAGVSLLTDDGQHFFWPAIAGAWQPHIGGGTPRDFGPCGDVLDANAPRLFKRLERRYEYFLATSPPVEEALLVPFYIEGKAAGTIWAIAHDDRRTFDAEDLRQLESLGRFASTAFQVTASLDRAFEQSRVAHGLMEEAVRSSQATAALNAELRASGKALRRSEGDLQDFVEHAAIGLHWVSPDGIILWANQFELDLLGCTREEYVGHHIADFHVDQPVIAAMLARLAGGDTLHDYEARVRCTDGSIRHVLISAHAHVKNGTFVHTRCFTRDITERKRAEEALRESEEFNRSIVESSPDCIKVLDLHGHLLAMLNGQELLGIADIRPYVNTSWVEFWEGGDRQAARAAVATAAAGGEGRFVGLFRTLRGESKWWDVTISPIRDADGKPARLLAISRDVTERKRAEMNLEFLVSLSQDLVRLTNVDEMIQSVGAKIGAYLNLSLCAFVEINEAADEVVIFQDWHRDDVPGLAGTYRLADFVEEDFIRTARAGEIIVVRDVATDPRTDVEKFTPLNIASFICVPLIRDGQWRSALCVYHSAVYDWREDEIELTRELTARIWTQLERLRTEEALRDREARYRQLFNSMDEGYCVIDVLFDERDKAVDVRYVEVNPSFERESGIHDATGKLLSEFCPNLEAHWLETYGNVALTGEPIRYTNEAKDLDDGWFDIYCFRLGGPDSRRVAVLFRNIKQRKNAEQALRESEERYRTLFESMDEAFCIIEMMWDEHGKPIDYRFVVVNPTFAKQTGMHDAAGKRMRELVPTLEDHWFEIYGNVARTGEPVRFVNEAKGMDHRWFDVYACRVGGPDSQKVAIIFSDISERRRSDEALRASEERYRYLFSSIDEGFCVIEMIFDEHEKAVDYRFLEVNPSFEQQTGMHAAAGKRMREFVPDFEASWFQRYGDVALTGEPLDLPTNRKN